MRSVNAWQAVETLPLMIDEHGSQDVMALDTLSRDCGFRYPVRGRTSIKSHNHVIFDISPCMFEALNCPSRGACEGKARRDELQQAEHSKHTRAVTSRGGIWLYSVHCSCAWLHYVHYFALARVTIV